MSTHLSTKKVIAYLHSLEIHKIRPGLERISAVLHAMNLPHYDYPSILIAGTNGKGSTAEIIHSILKESGLKVGIYTSPHLYNFEERIRINGTCINRTKVITLGESIIHYIEKTDIKLTYFEFVTVMGLLYFSENNIDIAILEVGMGGRLDAVNVVSPLLSVITEIAYDHEEWLGNSLTKIAVEKAGIIKENSIVISSCSNKTAKKVLQGTAKDRRSKIFFIKHNFSYKIKNTIKNSIVFDYLYEDYMIENLRINRLGEHFIANASCAVTTVLQLNKLNKEFSISENAILKGVENVKLPCRIEVVRTDPFIIIDVAHNEQGIEALVKTVKNNFKYDKIWFILGIMQNKMITSILRMLDPFTYRIILTKPESPRSADPVSIIDKNIFIAEKSFIIEKVADAINKTMLLASKNDLICVAGSFYTAAEAKTYFTQEEKYA